MSLNTSCQYCQYCAYVDVSDETQLRYQLNKSTLNFDEIFKYLTVQLSRDFKPWNHSRDILKKHVKLQFEELQKALKYKYIIERKTYKYRSSPLLQYLLDTLEKYVTAETTAYQVLLNHLATRDSMIEKKKIRKLNKKKQKNYTYNNQHIIDWADWDQSNLNHQYETNV